MKTQSMARPQPSRPTLWPHSPSRSLQARTADCILLKRLPSKIIWLAVIEDDGITSETLERKKFSKLRHWQTCKRHHDHHNQYHGHILLRVRSTTR